MNIAVSAKNLSRVFRSRTRDAGLKQAIVSAFKPRYTEKRALWEVSFEIPESQIMGLVGANGAGKTTLMKMLAGLLHPSHGTVTVLGYTPADREKSFLNQIGMVMGQKSQLWTDIPAHDTLELLADIYRIPSEVYTKRLDHLAHVFGVKDQLGVQVRRLSLGERMKLEIIASLLHQPKLLILDEPTIGLDVLAKEHIRDFVRNLNKEQKTTVLLSSHDMEDISELCEALLVVHKGELVYKGTRAEFSTDQALKSRVQEILSQ